VNKINNSYRELFERSVKVRHPPEWLARSSDGGYKNETVEKWWCGFLMAINHKIEKYEKGSFIIGRVSGRKENPYYTFSEHPHPHFSKSDAYTECRRLTETYKQKFGIFRMLQIVIPEAEGRQETEVNKMNLLPEDPIQSDTPSPGKKSLFHELFELCARLDPPDSSGQTPYADFLVLENALKATKEGSEIVQVLEQHGNGLVSFHEMVNKIVTIRLT